MAQTSSPPRIEPSQPPYEGAVGEQLAKRMPPGAPVEPLALFRTPVVPPELAAATPCAWQSSPWRDSRTGDLISHRRR